MYVIKSRITWPLGEWADWLGRDGQPVAYKTAVEARRAVTDLSADPTNRGREFWFAASPVPDPAVSAAADRRDYMV